MVEANPPATAGGIDLDPTEHEVSTTRGSGVGSYQEQWHNENKG